MTNEVEKAKIEVRDAINRDSALDYWEAERFTSAIEALIDAKIKEAAIKEAIRRQTSFSRLKD